MIEAVFEDLALKQQVFRELDRVARAGLRARHQHVHARHRRDRVGDVAARVGRRPALLQPGERDAAARDRARRAHRARRAGRRRSPSRSGSARSASSSATCPGFVGNRMMFPYMYETQFLVEEGATPEQVDRALTRLRAWRWGCSPWTTWPGSTSAWRVRQALGHFSDPRVRRPLVARPARGDGPARTEDAARAGIRYDEPRRPTPDPEVEALDPIASAADAGIARPRHLRRGDRRARDLRAGQRRRARRSRTASRRAPRTST